MSRTMTLPVLAAAALLTAAGFAPGAAFAGEFETNARRCADPLGDLDLRIGACTWLLQSGRIAEGSVLVVFHSRGNAWYQKGEADRAIADYTAALRIEPDDVDALYNRGVAWNEKGAFDRAVEDYTAALRIRPEDRDALYNRGNAWSEMGEYDRAIEDLTAALRIKPDDPEALYNRGIAWDDSGEYDRAIEDLTAALSLDPDKHEALNNRAISWKHKGDYDRAIEDLTAALRIEPDDNEVLYNRAIAWRRKGDYDRAIEDLTTALRIKPDDAEAINTLAWLLATVPDVRLRDGRRAVRLAEEAVSLQDDAQNRDTLAAAYAESNRLRDAVDAQEQALAMARAEGWSTEAIVDAESRLRLYRQGRPYRK